MWLANPLLYGQDWNDEAWAVCRSDMLIKGEDADNIALNALFSMEAKWNLLNQQSVLGRGFNGETRY